MGQVKLEGDQVLVLALDLEVVVTKELTLQTFTSVSEAHISVVSRQEIQHMTVWEQWSSRLSMKQRAISA